MSIWTLGEWKDGKYYVEGLEYQFPKRPPLKEIKNYGLPRTLQVWSRSDEYEQYDWSEGWESRINENPDQLDCIKEEVRKLHEGFWIFINGEAVYLNRFMYFFLNYYILQDTGEYPQYRDTSLYYYRFVEICENIKLCTGHTLLKARRLGATSMVVAKLLLKLITSENKSFGITSKTGKDAEGAFTFLIDAFQNLPEFLKPDQDGSTAPKKTLVLKKASKKISKENKRSGKLEGLNNKLDWRSTALNTYDSGAFEEILVDESGKYPSDVPITKYVPIVTKCVKKGARVTGKLSLPTTVNPPSNGGAEYREVWDDSDHLNADYLGQTRSGLYRIMIPAFCGFDGYIDQFGNSVIENPTPEQTAYLESLDGDCPDPTIGAKQYLQVIRKNLENDPEGLQEEVRMNPFDAEEVFETSNDSCIFEMDKLVAREKQLEEKLIDNGFSLKDGELGRRGWFIQDFSGRVQFKDDPKGLWYIHELLSPAESNKFKQVGNGKIPTNEIYGAAGLDPIAMGNASVDAGSDCCCMIRSRYTSVRPENSGYPVAMFLGRMMDVNKLYEQIYNGLQYYGIKMLAERAPISWHTYAEDNKLLGYLYGTRRSDGSTVHGIVAQQSEQVKQEHAEAQVMASLTDHDKVPFIRLIRDRKNFKVRKRTDYDACMADGYANMAMKFPIKQVKEANKKQKFIRKGKVYVGY